MFLKATYKLPNKRTVFLTSRPDVTDYKDQVRDFIFNNTLGIRFMFTDDFVDPPADSPPFHWFPWVPSENPPIENIFAFICLIDRFNNQRPLGESIWMHCDSSSMRAPTFMGFFLGACYPNEMEDICKNGKMSEYQRNSCPLKYLQIAYELDPKCKQLIEYWKSGGEKAAYDFYMGQEWAIPEKKIEPNTWGRDKLL